MIEMSCLTSQNNNCAAAHQESSSSTPESLGNSKDRTDQKVQNKKHRRSGDNFSSGENHL